jgi:hypothetical protein
MKPFRRVGAGEDGIDAFALTATKMGSRQRGLV